jgi:multiple sugar transport system substrate-binding protein
MKGGEVMKKVFSMVLIAILAFSVMLSLCSGKVTKTKIVYWHWDGNPTSMPIYQELVKRFMAKNPNIEVEFVGLPAESYLQKYHIAIATNSAPDAAGVRDLDIAALSNQDALEDLSGRFNSWNEKQKIAKNVLESVKVLAPNGKLYVLPFFVTVDTAWYNKKLFDQNGIKAPKTIDEFVKLCEKYANPKDGKYFFSLRGGAGSLENLWDFMFSYAGTNEVFDAKGNCKINGEKFVKGFELYSSIYLSGWVPKDSITNSFKEMVAEFGSGTSMYIYHNSSSLPEHLKNLGEGNFMNAPQPVGPAGIRVTKAPSFCGPVIFKSSRNKNAAWKFISYLASAEATSYLCEKEGRIPVNSGVYSDEWYKKNPYLKTYEDVLKDPNTKNLVHPQWLPQWSEFRAKVQEPDFQAVFLKQKTPKEVLDNWAMLLTQYQKEYLKSVKK